MTCPECGSATAGGECVCAACQRPIVPGSGAAVGGADGGPPAEPGPITPLPVQPEDGGRPTQLTALRIGVAIVAVVMAIWGAMAWWKGPDVHAAAALGQDEGAAAPRDAGGAGRR
jgi:hypothetical protein